MSRAFCMSYQPALSASLNIIPSYACAPAHLPLFTPLYTMLAPLNSMPHIQICLPHREAPHNLSTVIYNILLKPEKPTERRCGRVLQ